MAMLLARWESTFNAGHYDATAALYMPDAIRYASGADPQPGTCGPARTSQIANPEGVCKGRAVGSTVLHVTLSL